MSRTARFILFGTIFFTGAAVLIFEVAAVRALSPYFGSSIYVVSSVLTIILAALSLGYYFGGRLADKLPQVGVLYMVIGTSGLIMNVLFYFSQHIFPIAGSLFSITFGPLVLSAIFFLVPAFLLGIDSPFVIKLLTTEDDHEHNGAIVGSTFFWSTVGSIVGSLISGFLLIPVLGLQLTFVGTATLLSLLSMSALFIVRLHTDEEIPLKHMQFVTATAVLSTLMAVVILNSSYLETKPGKLLYETDGYYSNIQIRERTDENENTIRTLYRETNSASSIMTGTTTFVYRYSEYARSYRYLQEETDSFLLIGGGAYTLPRTLLEEDSDLTMDVVEIEPSLYDLAVEYFELPESPRLTNHPVDGRIFLNTTDKKYDVIFADAFQSGHFIPPHLITKEFFENVAQHLNDDGVFIANVIGVTGQEDQSLTGSLIKTIQSVFPALSMYSAQPYEDSMQNLMIVAKADGSPVELPEDFIIDFKDGTYVPAEERRRSLDLLHLDNQVVFTDNLAPIEPLLAKQLIEYY